MNIARYAMILACILFLQGCKIFATSIPAEPPVSVTKIQFDPEKHGWRKLEIVFLSKRGYDGFVGDVSLSAVVAFCSEIEKTLLDAMVVNVYFRYLVGEEENKSPVREPDGFYRYSALVSVSAEGIKEGRGVKGGGGGIPGAISYDLADVPQNLCSRASSTQMMLWYSYNWVAIPKEMIDRALALPPDPERSAAWRKERSYGWRPSLSGPQGGFKAWHY